MDPGRSPMFTIKYIYIKHISLLEWHILIILSQACAPLDQSEASFQMSLHASRPIRGQLSNEPARLSTNQRPAFK